MMKMSREQAFTLVEKIIMPRQIKYVDEFDVRTYFVFGELFMRTKSVLISLKNGENFVINKNGDMEALHERRTI